MIKNFVASFLLVFFNITATLSSDIKNLLPKSSELSSCKMSDTIRVYKGDELFNYVDGGAEIFMEYGFKQVATTNYADKNNNQFQVEIYEMKDSSAAYGAYTFYLNGEGKPFNAGTEGAFIDYFAVFWKGNFLTVISASEYKDVLEPVFKEIATVINSKISSIAQAPSMIVNIKKSGVNEGYIKYLNGNVGLSNVYRFIPGNSFTFNEGVSFNMTEAQVIIMKFESEATATFRLSEAKTKMKEANKETTFTDIDKGFSFPDYKLNQINCICYTNYIIILIGKTQENCNSGFEKVKRILD
jgi:hypothetical protein